MGATQDNTSYRSVPRVNGCSLPLNVLQVVAWCALLYLIIQVITTMIPGIITSLQIYAYVGFIVTLMLHVIPHIVTMICNPADPGVREKMKDKVVSVGQFDRQQHKHVIENSFCYLCEVNVLQSSKHCSACNKCVEKFDHHCKWLNNCVGSRNYRWFIATMVSALIGCLAIFSISILQFIAYFTDKANGHILQQFKDHLDKVALLPLTTTTPDVSTLAPTTTVLSTLASTVITTGNNVTEVTMEMPTPVFKIFYIPVPVEVWLSVTMFTAVLTLVGIVLIGHLMSFHIYLCSKGITTYEYIVNARLEAEEQARSADMESIDPEKFKSSKSNAVAPNIDSPPCVDLESQRSAEELAAIFSATKEADRQEMEAGETPPPPAPYKMPPKPKTKETGNNWKDGKFVKANGTSIYSARDLTTSPRSQIDLYLQTPSKSFKQISDVKAASPAQEYDSDSAESLKEIPISQTRVGNLYRNSPRQSDYLTSDSSNLTMSLDRRRIKRHTKERYGRDNLNMTTTFEINGTANFNPDGSFDYTRGFRTLPLTPLNRRRHNEVPPLDLSSLNEDSDGFGTTDRARRSSKKKKRKKQRHDNIF